MPAYVRAWAYGSSDGMPNAVRVIMGNTMSEEQGRAVMKRWHIYNRASGISLGVWGGADEGEAFAMFCRQAGITPEDIDADLACELTTAGDMPACEAV